MTTVESIERCPACRARFGAAEVCSRCGTDFSMTRRAERQAQALARLALQQYIQGQSAQAGDTAAAACSLSASPLARAVAQLACHRAKLPKDQMQHQLADAAPADRATTPGQESTSANAAITAATEGHLVL